MTLEETIINALKKQIARKPLHLHKNYYCPVCKEDGWVMWDDAIPTDMDNYCCVCGQRLDWEELSSADVSIRARFSSPLKTIVETLKRRKTKNG